MTERPLNAYDAASLLAERRRSASLLPAGLAVLASLAGAQLLPGEGDWREALSG